MTILELANKLKAIYDKNGNIDVLVIDYRGDPIQVDSAAVEVVLDDDDYPEDYNMPKGFTFVCLGQ